jgi:hypothetical protein
MLTRFITLCSLLVITQLQAQIIISEFLADNVSGIKDENDSRQDWIELYNSSSSTVSVSGWWLTDKTTNTALWQFPNVSIPAMAPCSYGPRAKIGVSLASRCIPTLALRKAANISASTNPMPPPGNQSW